jgi:MFS family permease
MFPVAALFGIAAAARQWGVARLSFRAAVLHEDPRPSSIAGTLRDDRRFRSILTAAFLFGLGIWLLQPLTPIVQADILHATPVNLGVGAAAASIFGLFAVGYWSRGIDRRPSAAVLQRVYALGVWSPILYLGGMVIRNPWLVIAPMIVDSLVASGLDIVANLAVIDSAGARSGQYLGIYQMLAGIRGIVGPFLGAWVLHRAGIGSAFGLAALTMILGAGLAGSGITAPSPPPRVRSVLSRSNQPVGADKQNETMVEAAGIEPAS